MPIMPEGRPFKSVPRNQLPPMARHRKVARLLFRKGGCVQFSLYCNKDETALQPI